MKIKILFLGVILLFLGCKEPEARRPVVQKTTNVYQQLVASNKKLNAIEEQKIAAIIAKDTLHQYYTSPNGFWYFYNKKIKKDTLTPKANDLVTIEYSISDLEGNPIYTAEELGIKTYKVDKEDFIPALQHGIKLMHKGETLTFVIPSYSAFGVSGDGNKIGINQSIISKVTLIDLKINK